MTALLLLIIWQAVAAVWRKQYRESFSAALFLVVRWAWLLLAVLYLLGWMPSLLMAKDMLPFLFEKLAFAVGILIPIGAVALNFLIGFGVMEFIGVWLDKLMRPLFLM